MGEARKYIEEQLAKQFNSSISKQLSKQLTEKLGEVKTSSGEAEKYRAKLAEKER